MNKTLRFERAEEKRGRGVELQKGDWEMDEMKIRIPAIYIISDPKTGKILDRLICSNKEEATKIAHKLLTFEKSGLIKLKKLNGWIQNFRGYGQHTKINGRIIPIIEYEFLPIKK